MMGPMQRDQMGRCVTVRGRLAAHRRCDPPRTEEWSFRTTPSRYDRLQAHVAAGGYHGRADAVDDAVALLAALLRQEPLPAWVSITGPIRTTTMEPTA